MFSISPTLCGLVASQCCGLQLCHCCFHRAVIRLRCATLSVAYEFSSWQIFKAAYFIVILPLWCRTALREKLAKDRGSIPGTPTLFTIEINPIPISVSVFLLRILVTSVGRCIRWSKCIFQMDSLLICILHCP